MPSLTDASVESVHQSLDGVRQSRRRDLDGKDSSTAEKLRRMMNLGQFLQSHALSFFYLSGPDLLLGWDSDPATRNVFGLIKANPELARKGIRVRQFGQQVIEHLGGKRIHPAWAVPGGVRSGLTEESRQALLAWIPETMATLKESLNLFKGLLDSFKVEEETFGNFRRCFSHWLRMTGPGSTTAVPLASSTPKGKFWRIRFNRRSTVTTSVRQSKATPT